MTITIRAAVAALVASTVVFAACTRAESGDTTIGSALATTTTTAAPATTPTASSPVVSTPTAESAATTVPATETTETTTTTDTTEPIDTTDATMAPTTEPPVVNVELACARSIPLRERIALLVWPAVYSADWESAVSTVGSHLVGGVLLMRPTGWGPDDLRTGLARLDGAARRGLVVATDEEGGAVQRLSMLGELPAQQDVSEQLAPAEAGRIIADHAVSVADVGVDMVLGPVVDVVPADGDVPLTRSRFFTGDPTTVSAYARAYVDAWRSAGLVPVLKHFPGHGGASGDTHDEQGVTAPIDELAARDLVPYREVGRTAVMVGHLTVPGLTDGLPATLSPEAIAYLRDDLGYADELVMTDALGMQAVGLPEDAASVLAIAAGIDVVIFTNTAATASVIDGIERAVSTGDLSEGRVDEAATRVLRLLEPAACDIG